MLINIMDIYEKVLPGLILWLNENKSSLGNALSGGTMAILRSIHQGESLKKTCTEGGMCALAAFSISEILETFELQPDLAFPAAIFLGYVGIASVLQLIKLKTGSDKNKE